jgi:hypothetical protein
VLAGAPASGGGTRPSDDPARIEGLLSIANTGAAFPVPDRRRGQQRYPYGDAAPTYAADWPRYLARAAGLLVVLAVMAGVLVWAVFELGEGWSAVVDLFRDDSPATTRPAGDLLDALGGSVRF